MIVVLKFLIAVAVAGILRSSETFRTRSREFDEAALVALQRMVRASEESGFAPETIPVLVALSTIALIAMMMASGLFAR